VSACPDDHVNVFKSADFTISEVTVLLNHAPRCNPICPVTDKNNNGLTKGTDFGLKNPLLSAIRCCLAICRFNFLSG